MDGIHCHRLDHVPDLVSLSNSFPEHFPYLLDHAASGSQAGHSLLLFASGESLVQSATGELTGPGEGDDFFTRLESWFQQERAGSFETRSSLFSGGWFLFIGYEMAARIEPVLKLPPNDTGLPDAIATRCHGAVVVDHAEPGKPGSQDRASVMAETSEIMQAIFSKIRQQASPAVQPVPVLNELQEENPQKFRSGVLKVLEYLRAGDVFQVNISRHWNGTFAGKIDPYAVYQNLRSANPAPFAGMMNWQGRQLLSSSPERLVQIQGRKIQTRPIAGTRSRGHSEEQDLALSRELIDNVKERAEHIMLIDLERNDMGRVCLPGSIHVNELMVIESYAHVHHIVSNIEGTLKASASPIDALKAVFPGGTITGCPKVRCMEIIAELEQEGRGFYTGSMGYLGIDGNMDLNILIRSMLLHGKSVSFRTGAGIVADSEPERELTETREKARGLLLALQPEKEADAHA